MNRLVLDASVALKALLPKEQDFITPCLNLYPYADLFDRALEIATRFRTGFYDSCYTALAEQEGCPLVTTDDKLINSLPGFPIVHLRDV